MAKFYKSLNIATEELKKDPEFLKDMKNDRLNVSMEYRQIDLPQTLLSLLLPVPEESTTVWRQLFNNSSVSRDNIGLITEIFLDKFSTRFEKYYLHWWRGLTSGVILTLHPWLFLWPGMWADVLLKYKKWSGSKYGQADGEPIWNCGYLLEKDDNAYYQLITCYKNVDWDDHTKYALMVDGLNAFVDYTFSDKGACKKIPHRAANIGEKNDLKLWRPDKIESEITRAIAYVNTKVLNTKPNGKEWEKIYNRLIEIINRVVTEVNENIHNGYND